MTLRLYGSDACTDCILAKKLLEGYGIEYEWIDVATITGFEGEIPRLIPDNGSIIIGLGKIKNYIIKM